MVARILILIMVCGASAARIAAQSSPTAIPPSHRILLATLADTHEQIAIIDYKAFRSVDALKQYISSLPAGASVYFHTWDHTPDERENRFVAAGEDLKKFCGEHHITLHLKTVAPYF